MNEKKSVFYHTPFFLTIYLQTMEEQNPLRLIVSILGGLTYALGLGFVVIILVHAVGFFCG
jgi:hypothetical protein